MNLDKKPGNISSPEGKSLSKTVVVSALLFLIVLLALPHPFNCLLDFSKTCCACACPWWIFAFLQLLLSLVWRSRHRAVIHFLIAFSVSLAELFSVRYYLALQSFAPHPLCSHFWLISLLIALPFVIIGIFKKG